MITEIKGSGLPLEAIMYKVFEIDYNGKCYFLGSADTVKDACKIEKKALKKSHGEFPTFTSDGKKCVTNNGEII